MLTRTLIAFRLRMLHRLSVGLLAMILACGLIYLADRDMNEIASSAELNPRTQILDAEEYRKLSNARAFNLVAVILICVGVYLVATAIRYLLNWRAHSYWHWVNTYQQDLSKFMEIIERELGYEGGEIQPITIGQEWLIIGGYGYISAMKIADIQWIQVKPGNGEKKQVDMSVYTQHEKLLSFPILVDKADAFLDEIKTRKPDLFWDFGDEIKKLWDKNRPELIRRFIMQVETPMIPQSNMNITDDDGMFNSIPTAIIRNVLKRIAIGTILLVLGWLIFQLDRNGRDIKFTVFVFTVGIFLLVGAASYLIRGVYEWLQGDNHRLWKNLRRFGVSVDELEGIIRADQAQGIYKLDGLEFSKNWLVARNGTQVYVNKISDIFWVAIEQSDTHCHLIGGNRDGTVFRGSLQAHNLRVIWDEIERRAPNAINATGDNFVYKLWPRTYKDDIPRIEEEFTNPQTYDDTPTQQEV